MNKKGFTLVEILAVIVILSLLVVITATKGFGIFDKTKEKITMQNVNAIEEATRTYMVDVQNCDDNLEEYKELGKVINVSNIKDCSELKKVFTEQNPKNISLNDLINNGYVSGSAIESLPDEVKDEITVETYFDNNNSIVAKCVDCLDNINSNKVLLAKQIINIAKSTSKSDSENHGYALYQESPMTSPAVEISKLKEATLSKTEDNFGYSYFFRGNVKNNYINFAGMCWNIVRILGDNSIKLVLYDKNKECSSATGEWAIGHGNFGYKKIVDNGNTVYVDSFMSPEENKDKSLIYNLEEFQKKKLREYYSKLSNINVWCYTNKAYSDKSGSNELNTLDYKFKTNIFFDSQVRLSKSYTTNNRPTLKCNGIYFNYYSDNIPLYVGALTADEVVYSGIVASAISNDNNNNGYYLKTNSNKKWWTMSPAFLSQYGYVTAFDVVSGNRTNNYFIYETELTSSNNSADYRYFRPAITLKSTVKYLSGKGTKSDPYIVE